MLYMHMFFSELIPLFTAACQALLYAVQGFALQSTPTLPSLDKAPCFPRPLLELFFAPACQGLLYVVQGALPHFALLCEAFASWRRFLDNGLHNEMAQVMQLYKQSLAAAGQWDAATSNLSQHVRERLNQSFVV